MTNGTARSFCTVIRASNNAYSCVTGPPVVFDQPFSGSQGVKRQLWNADILSRNASLALNFPLANPDFQEILTTPSLKFTYSAQPFVQTFSTILTLPNNFSGILLQLFSADDGQYSAGALYQVDSLTLIRRDCF